MYNILHITYYISCVFCIIMAGFYMFYYCICYDYLYMFYYSQLNTYPNIQEFFASLLVPVCWGTGCLSIAASIPEIPACCYKSGRYMKIMKMYEHVWKWHFCMSNVVQLIGFGMILSLPAERVQDPGLCSCLPAAALGSWCLVPPGGTLGTA